MNWKNWLASIASAGLLAACGGGGGNAGTSPFGGGGGGTTDPVAVAAAVDVTSSKLQLDSGVGDSAVITVVVKKAGSVVLPDAPVTLVASSGSLAVASATTNSAGVVTATLTPGSSVADKANRTITVTATSGSVSSAVTVQVAGTTVSYSGATSLSVGSSPTSLKVLLKDAKGAAVSNASVKVSASQVNNPFAATTVTTDGNGVATFSYTPANAGSDALIFSALGATVTANLSISGEDFVFVTPAANQQITIGDSQPLTVRYRLSGEPQSGKTVNFATTGGTLSAGSVVTNPSGEASVSVSSTFAGSANVSATINGVGTITLPVSFVAVTPSKLVLQVSPSAIGANQAGSTTQQATVLARVTDAQGNPVANKVVNFARTADPSNGNLSAASATTDANGEASVKYISGSLATASNGVQLTATVAGTAVTGTAALTVSEKALFIALGTGNEITNLNTTTYRKEWTVYVTDANGVAVSGVNLTLRLLPMMYGKGSMGATTTETSSGAVASGAPWTVTNYTGATSTTSNLPAGQRLWCYSEDLANFNGVLDAGEDINSSGALEPGNVIALAPGSGSVTTDVNGRATIFIDYAESYAPWVNVTLRATAVVSGTESMKEANFTVTGSATDLNNMEVPPAGLNSPFGQKASCSVAG